ncbi:MAG: TIGR03905 family TSCPD domain-containing protein [Paraprevotella sp.]|nr:TIGR03905 family TSCPD domain-containing protein [Paraprevotella sp.]
MKTVYYTQGTCSQAIELELDGVVVKSVRFAGGCHGNLQGIARLVEGMKVGDVIARLNGIRCGMKATSCPDQLCRALEQAMQQ